MNRNNRKGILLMVAAVFAFACQDGFARHLAGTYNTMMVVMVRYWLFAGFVIVLALRRPEGFRAAITSHWMGAHVVRSVLLVSEICIIVWGYTLIGLIESHAVFAVCPLLIVALSGPVLGEQISWKRWAAVFVGMIGVVIILRPGSGVFSWPAILPLVSAFFFATYSVLTRLTTRDEPTFPAFFWPGVIGAVLMTLFGLPEWEAVAPQDWAPLAIYASLSIFSHWLLLKCYQVAEASSVQPFAYLQIAFVSVIGITIYDEDLALPVIVGAALIIAAGLYALWSERAAKVA